MKRKVPTVSIFSQCSTPCSKDACGYNVVDRQVLTRESDRADGLAGTVNITIGFLLGRSVNSVEEFETLAASTKPGKANNR